MKFDNIFKIIIQSQNLQKQLQTQFDNIKNDTNNKGYLKLCQNIDTVYDLCKLLFVDNQIKTCNLYAFTGIQHGYLKSFIKGQNKIYSKQTLDKASKIHQFIRNRLIQSVTSQEENIQQKIKQCFINCNLPQKLGTSKKFYNDVFNKEDIPEDTIDPQCKEFYIFLQFNLKNNQPFMLMFYSFQNFSHIASLIPASFKPNNYGKKMAEITNSKKLVGFKQVQLLKYIEKKNIGLINYIEEDLLPVTKQFFNMLNQYCNQPTNKALTKCKIQNIDTIPSLFSTTSKKLLNLFNL